MATFVLKIQIRTSDTSEKKSNLKSLTENQACANSLIKFVRTYFCLLDQKSMITNLNTYFVKKVCMLSAVK